MAVGSAARAMPPGQIGPDYREVLTLVERLHRRLLDIIRNVLVQEQCAEVNSVQALLLYNVGDRELTASELRTRGYYLGSNVSYNLKKLTDEGFLNHQRSRTDRRAVCITLTEKGRAVRDMIAQRFDKHLVSLAEDSGVAGDDLTALNKGLVRLERFWTDQIIYRM